MKKEKKKKLILCLESQVLWGGLVVLCRWLGYYRQTVLKGWWGKKYNFFNSLQELFYIELFNLTIVCVYVMTG